jgi:hypothetical protein
MPSRLTISSRCDAIKGCAAAGCRNAAEQHTLAVIEMRYADYRRWLPKRP